MHTVIQERLYGEVERTGIPGSWRVATIGSTLPVEKHYGDQVSHNAPDDRIHKQRDRDPVILVSVWVDMLLSISCECFSSTEAH